MNQLTFKKPTTTQKVEAISNDILRIAAKAVKAPTKVRLKFYSLVTVRMQDLNDIVSTDESVTSLPIYQKAILKCIEINNNL